MLLCISITDIGNVVHKVCMILPHMQQEPGLASVPVLHRVFAALQN